MDNHRSLLKVCTVVCVSVSNFIETLNMDKTQQLEFSCIAGLLISMYTRYIKDCHVYLYAMDICLLDLC